MTERRKESRERNTQDATEADQKLLQMLDRMLTENHALADAIADARASRGNLDELRGRLDARRRRLQRLQEELARTEKAILSDEASVEGLSLIERRHRHHVASLRAAFGDDARLLLETPIPGHLKDAILLELFSLRQCQETTAPAAIQRIMTIVHWLREQCEMRVAPCDPFVIPEDAKDTTSSPKKTPPPQNGSIEHLPIVKAASVPPTKATEQQTREHREQLRVHIRWMIRRDMPEVLQIEEKSFEIPWTEEDFLRCLRQRDCIGMVAEHGEKVVGFMIYELHLKKVHILNFATHPDFRDSGIGRNMVAELIGKLHSHRRMRITLEVRETNLGAQLFFKKHGFLARKVLKNYYEDTGEDALLMEYLISGSESELDEEACKGVNRIAPHIEERPEPPPQSGERKPPDGDDDDPKKPALK